MDATVGRVLDTLDRLAVTRDTIVLWCTDNGAEQRRPWRGSSGPWSGFYNTVMEGGRIPRGGRAACATADAAVQPVVRSEGRDRRQGRQSVGAKRDGQDLSWRLRQQRRAIPTCRRALPIRTSLLDATEGRSALSIDRTRRRGLSAQRAASGHFDDERRGRFQRQRVRHFRGERLS